MTTVELIPPSRGHIECQGLGYGAEGAYWIRPRQGPEEPRTTLLHTSQPRQRLVGMSREHVRHLGHPVWVSIAGRWLPEAGIEVVSLQPVTDFVDFWSPPPVSRFPGFAPKGGVDMTDDLKGVIAASLRLGTVVSCKVLRAVRGGEVLAVAAANVERAAFELGRFVGGRLRIWESPWTREEFQQCGNELAANVEAWRLTTLGNHVGPRGQDIHVASPIVLSEAFVEWRRQWTPGLLDVRPWIRTVAAPGPRRTTRQG